MPSAEVFAKACHIAVGQLVQSAEVHIVFEVGTFHFAADGVGGGTTHILVVRLVLTSRHRQDRVDNLTGEPLFQQVRGSHIGIFDGVVQQGHNLGFRATASLRHTEGVRDIIVPCLVALAGVGTRGDGKG